MKGSLNPGEQRWCRHKTEQESGCMDLLGGREGSQVCWEVCEFGSSGVQRQLHLQPAREGSEDSSDRTKGNDRRKEPRLTPRHTVS